MKIEKCYFLENQINFLGYTKNQNGLSPNNKNISIVVNFPTQKNFRESFIGLVSHFRMIILNFALIAKPLYDLLKNGTIF